LITENAVLELPYEQQCPGVPHSDSLTEYYGSFEECQLAGNTTKIKVFLSPFPGRNTELSIYAGRQKRKITA